MPHASVKDHKLGGEHAFIDWIKRRVPKSSRMTLGPGDDAAIVAWADFPYDCVATTDMLLDGSCFRLEEAGPVRVGRKSMAVNLSDIAAMAARPVAALVSVGLPRKGGRHLAEKLFAGMQQMAELFQVPIVGGDTNSWNGPLVISVTLLGEVTDRGAVKRSGARPGDWLITTGPLGGSILSKHLDFLPRVPEALELHRAVPIHAMIDISDGLARDLHQLCKASSCGAILQADRIPISRDAEKLALTSGQTPLEHALGDGEDFELLMAIPESHARKLIDIQPLAGVELHCIGTFVDEEVWIDHGDGPQPLAPLGYDHTLA
jgi:thiamine-monophosphate kinase